MQPNHPLHTLLLAGAVPVFLGALFADVAYARSYEIQWKNFASWSLAWGLLLAGFALLWTLVGLASAGGRSPRRLASIVLLLAAFVIGLVNALVHAGDAWASMPAGLVLSAIVSGFAFAAAWFGLSSAAMRAPVR